MKYKGFTLLEVLIALVVIALGLAALVKTSSHYVDNHTYLRDKTFAHWVAMNVITELHVKRTWLPIGKKTGDSTMVQRTWYWTILTTATLDETLRRVIVKVSTDEAQRESLLILTGFISAVNKTNDTLTTL